MQQTKMVPWSGAHQCCYPSIQAARNRPVRWRNDTVMGRISRLFLASMFLMIAPAPAQNVTITPSVINAPALGIFVAGSTTSSYTLDSATGTITRVSGDAFPVTKSVAVNTVTINCANCRGGAGNRTINVSITANAPSGRFSITNFTRSNAVSTPAGSTVTGASSGSPLNFTIVLPNGGGAKSLSFRLGLSFQLANSGGTGGRAFNYTIVATRVNP